MATFGRGFWVLDDYSALREVSAQTMGEEARMFPMRDRRISSRRGALRRTAQPASATLGGNYTMPNPPIRRGDDLQRARDAAR